MGYQKYLKKLWEQPKKGFGTLNWRTWLETLRAQPAILRVDHPTRPDRAHALGFKAKEGFVIVRSRVTRGGRKRPKPPHGRKPSASGRFYTARKSDQLIAEEHVQKYYVNCEVLNSYWVGEDGRYKWYEVILVDRSHPVIKADKRINWISKERGRVYHGLTSAGKKARGLRTKGIGSYQFRPSKSSRGAK
ncbi:MAG: 50S ribosomal protein L15e [archaeon]